MGLVVPAFYLALLHIAGDNLAVAPDLAAIYGRQMYTITLLVYLVLGSVITGMFAWVGIRTGKDLIAVVNKMMGYRGKILCAVIILTVCLPASALTGGYYGGLVLSKLTGLSHCAAALICLVVYSMLALGYFSEVLKFSNMISLLLLPLFIVGVYLIPVGSISNILDNSSTINWSLVFALVAYNSGGMRSLLVVEAAATLSKRGYKVIYFSVLGKMVEGIFTLLMVHYVIMCDVGAPLTLAAVFEHHNGKYGQLFFYIVALCTFTNTMAPAMLVNANQITTLLKMKFWVSMLIGIGITYVMSFLKFELMITFLSVAGIIVLLSTLVIVIKLLKMR